MVVGPEHQVGVFPERHVGALAIDLGGGGDHDELLLLVGVLQHDFGAVHVGLDGVDRRSTISLTPTAAARWNDHVAAVDELGEQRLVRHDVDRVVKPRVRPSDGDVVDGPGREVVENEDLVAASSSASARWEPMKPAPPVISTRNGRSPVTYGGRSPSVIRTAERRAMPREAAQPRRRPDRSIGRSSAGYSGSDSTRSQTRSGDRAAAGRARERRLPWNRHRIVHQRFDAVHAQMLLQRRRAASPRTDEQMVDVAGVAFGRHDDRRRAGEPAR